MRPLEGDGGPGTESMTEEQRIILRDGISEQVMGWTSRRVSWAYAETAELWHDADDNPLMTRDSWRPDTNDSQVLEVLDRMVELGFRYTLGSVDETAYAEFHRAGDQSARAEHIERRIALLRAAVTAVRGDRGTLDTND